MLDFNFIASLKRFGIFVDVPNPPEQGSPLPWKSLVTPVSKKELLKGYLFFEGVNLTIDFLFYNYSLFLKNSHSFTKNRNTLILLK